MLVVDKIIDSITEKGGKLASFSIEFPNNKVKKTGNGKDEFVIQIKSSEVYRQIIKKGQLGIGEQYMLGNLNIEGDMYKALELAQKIDVGAKQSQIQKTLFSIKRMIFKNERDNALKNVSHHYDLGNDFYEKWLDKSMTYSCGYFKTPSDTLNKAQEQKLEHICRKLILKKGETLVDFGSGWGSMLIYAAQKYKVKGYGVSLSKEQVKYANDKAKKLGLQKLVQFELKDYRDVKGKFDKFVSIGMFEHVGKDYYDNFFEKVNEILMPGGLGLLHTIGLDRPVSQESFEWVLTYIFPGGYLPCLEEVYRSSTKYNLVPLDMENLRMHYALTLKHWIKNYEKVFEETAKKRGIEFARMWRLYLYLSAVYFEFNKARLFQFTFSSGLNNNLPLTRDHIYK